MLRLFSVKIVTIIFVLLLLPCSVIAKKRALLFGGGCDSLAMDENSFKPEFKKFVKTSSALRSRGWEVEGQYGRESQLDEFRKQSGISNANKATKNNLIKALDRAVNEMEKGDQFLLTFATHGSDGRENKRSHSICTETDEVYDRLGKKFFKDYGKVWTWENRDLREISESCGFEV